MSQDTILDWIASGRLQAYGGKPTNPFLRSADVATLVEQLGLEQDTPPRRTKSASAKVQARLTADSRWSDVSDEDLRNWATRTEPVRRKAARTTVRAALERLEAVLRALDAVD